MKPNPSKVAKVIGATLCVWGTPAFSDETKLRCDLASGSGAPVVMTIDTSNKVVHWGVDPDRGLYRDNQSFQVTEDDNSNQGAYGGRACRLRVQQFVSISDQNVKFGSLSININACGLRDYANEYAYKPGEQKNTYTYIINKDTGYLIYYIDDVKYSEYQCHTFTGPVIK